MSKPDLRPHAYVLAVRDLPGSAAYFADVLGFKRDWNDGENWQALIRGGVRVMLGRCPDALPPAELGDHSYFGYFATDDVDALYQEFVARDARLLSAPADKPWGWREMPVATPEGHRVMFAQRIQRSSSATTLQAADYPAHESEPQEQRRPVPERSAASGKPSPARSAQEHLREQILHTLGVLRKR